MKKYYVNTQAQFNGDHEVHDETCRFLPVSANRIYLGEYHACASAVSAAKKHYVKVDGCYFCSPTCHKS
jgi:hypothetical protein